MLILLQVVLVIFAIVVFAELLWRTKILESEYSRKLIHILVGSFAASWAFYLNDTQIVLLASAMFGVVLISRVFRLFASIHTVNRKTWGELFFPLGIALCALLTDSPWIFLAAILHVSVADGLAALIGRKYVKKHGYRIFGQQKTLVGSLTFFNTSLAIILAVTLLAPELSIHLMLAITLPLTATVAENIGLYGSDDVLIPIAVVAMFSSL
jgi:phytol kinase